MGNLFAITTPTDDVKADAGGKATAVFTVTNTSGKPVRGIARAKALGNTEQDWLEIEGETERDFSANGTQQFTVNFHKPASPGAATEKFPFRLDVASAADPDEQFTEGPAVNVEMKPGGTPPVKKTFPWWILAIVGVVLLIIIIVIVFLLMRGRTPNENSNTTPTPVVSPTVAPGTVIEVYNFFDRAPSAVWANDARELINFGTDYDTRGIVIQRPNTFLLEDGKGYEKVLETHPHYVAGSGGKTTGTYQLTEAIRAGDKFRTRLGFYKEAVDGDLRVRLLLNGVVINELPKKYDGSLRDWTIDLSDYAGQTGTMSLESWAQPTSRWGWICWINPRIERVAK